MSAQAIDPARIVDLTYPFNEHTVYWPNNDEGFRHKRDVWGATDAGSWYASAQFSSAEHGGTHLDSPIHFAEGKWTVEQIPVQRLAGPLALIDVSAAAAKDRDYRATLRDLLTWEKANGRIAPGMIVIFRTGWGRHWPNRKQYLGSDVPGDVTNLHFPGISGEVAMLLVVRQVAGVGIDTASIDYGPEQTFVAHRILLGANIYALENVANIDRLPAKGATLIALPMKIEGGSGAPVRIIAIVP
ncbi:MAG: cyclase family protein [Candidatus Korobacteraceae bacterium]